MKRLPLVALLTVCGCNLSPLMNRIEIGEDPILVVTGEGKDGRTDLFAVHAGGGSLSQLTFTNQVERGPRLTVDGGVLAFLRMRDTLPATEREVVMMNLVSGTERKYLLPEDAGQPQLLGWSDDARTLYVQTDRGRWAITAPPGDGAMREVAAEDAAADTALTLWLGMPRFAKGISCGSGICAVTARGDTMTLTPQGRDPFRWGTDSLAWFEGENLTVRSLGPGVTRRVEWSSAPSGVRDGAYAAGARKAPTP